MNQLKTTELHGLALQKSRWAKPNVKAHFAGAFQRIFHDAKPWRYVLWWVVRALFIYAIIHTWIDPRNKSGNELSQSDKITTELQLVAHLLCCCLWELFQFLPRRRTFRWLPHYVQDFAAIISFCTAYGGKTLDLYGRWPWWDSVVHFAAGMLIVGGGYEYFVARQKKDHFTAPASIAIVYGLGISFMSGVFWELYEFLFDQLTGGNTQAWQYSDTYGLFGVLKNNDADFLRHERYGLLDTMTDIFANTTGAMLGYFALKTYPYLHKGKRDINAKLESGVVFESSTVEKKAGSV
ncbi:MAG: hypothetical protein LBS96_01260 [Oscillospiraceae bacterium]|jgi:hypothetical protein|nr:hypothetical protein [Oscillospiraceae bacterium]